MDIGRSARDQSHEEEKRKASHNAILGSNESDRASGDLLELRSGTSRAALHGDATDLPYFSLPPDARELQ